MHLVALIALLAAPVATTTTTTTGAIADTLPQGTVGLSFGFPAGGSFSPFASAVDTTAAAAPTPAADIGVTYFIAPQTAIRLDFGLSVNFSGPRSGSANQAFDIQLGLRMYRAHHDRLWFFLQPGVGFGRVEAAEYMNIGGGLGAEYFFTDRFSVGGMLGLALQINNIGGTGDVGTSLYTGTSNLFASVYF